METVGGFPKTRKLSEKEMHFEAERLAKNPVISYLKTAPCQIGNLRVFFEFDPNYMIRCWICWNGLLLVSCGWDAVVCRWGFWFQSAFFLWKLGLLNFSGKQFISKITGVENKPGPIGKDMPGFQRFSVYNKPRYTKMDMLELDTKPPFGQGTSLNRNHKVHSQAWWKTSIQPKCHKERC